MKLDEKQIDEFETQGFTLIDNVFSSDEMDAAAVAINELHADQPTFVGSIEDERLLFLFHDERIEAIAKHILAADQVIHASNTSLFRASGDDEWKPTFEHVDIMYSMDERRARPRRMYCMMMVFIDDLPENIATANQLGLQGILFHNRGQGIAALKAQVIDTIASHE